MPRFKNSQLLDSNSPDYINDIQLLQIILNERRAKLDMYNPLNTRLNRMQIDLDGLKDIANIKSITDTLTTS